jgi:hypothetical protein
MRLVVEGDTWDALTPTIQDAGVDTLECSFDMEVSEAMRERLEVERFVPQTLMSERRATHAPEWLGAQISPTGARGGYHFLLETPTFAIKLLRGIPNGPPIDVELRAFACIPILAARWEPVRPPAPSCARSCSPTSTPLGQRAW